VRPIHKTVVPLPSKCCILYIFSTNISTEYFKHAAHSPFFSSKCRLFIFFPLSFIVPPFYCATSLLYHQSIVPPVYCTTSLLCHQSIVPPVYCTTSLLCHQSIVPPVYCTTSLLYHQSIVPPVYCTTSLLQTISTFNLISYADIT
jgi:hypothetical protein